MFKKLLSSLDEKVFTSDLKESLETQFNEAVELKSMTIAADKIEEKTVELEEKAEEYNAILEQESKEKEDSLLEQVDAYLEKVVEDFIVEAQDSLDESIKSEKADMIIESMDAMIVATGVDIAQITEAIDNSDPENKLAESIEKYDAIVEENIALEKTNAKLLKMGIVAELKEGMNVIDAEKFAKLADLVEFSDSTNYLDKLDTIKESVKTLDTVVEKREYNFGNLDEKTKEKTPGVHTSFSHLI